MKKKIEEFNAMQYTEDEGKCYLCNEEVMLKTVINEDGAHRLASLCDEHLKVVVHMQWGGIHSGEELNKIIDRIKGE